MIFLPKSNRKICPKSHDKASNHGGQSRRDNEFPFGFFHTLFVRPTTRASFVEVAPGTWPTWIGQDPWIYSQNVSHREKSSHCASEFSEDRSATNLKGKNWFAIRTVRITSQKMDEKRKRTSCALTFQLKVVINFFIECVKHIKGMCGILRIGCRVGMIWLFFLCHNLGYCTM